MDLPAGLASMPPPHTGIETAGGLSIKGRGAGRN